MRAAAAAVDVHGRRDAQDEARPIVGASATTDPLRDALRELTATTYTDDETRKMTPDQLRAALLRLAEVNSLKNNSRT